MICADCKRQINKPALTIGRFHFGPVCAKRYILRPTRTLTPVYDRRPRAVVVDPDQIPIEFA